MMFVDVRNIDILIFLVTIYFFGIAEAHAQEIYYRDDKGNTYTLQQHQENLKKLYAMRKENGQDVAVLQTFHRTERKGDSLIKYYSVREDKSLWQNAPEYEERSHLEKYIGHLLPTASLESLSKNTITLGKVQKKPMILNLWFTQCVPCRAEIPLLNQLQRKYKDEVNFVSMTFRVNLTFCFI